MEARKYFDYTQNSPIVALSATTERWGLGRFPPNIAAFNHTRTSDNASLVAWALPFPCSTPTDDRSDTITISPSDKICTNARVSPVCPASDCILLIEGIGKTRAGPAHTSIIGLSHGIAFILASIATISITMWSPLRSLLKGHPKNSKGRQSKTRRPTQRLEVDSIMNPPRRPPAGDRYAEQAMTPEKLSKEVSECSALLRQLYALELEIWAQKGVVAAEIPKREESQRRANALFAEIRRKINNLKSMPSAQWSPQERKIIEEICNVVNRQGEKRY